MKTEDEIVEVAILKSTSHYDHYGDENGATLAQLLGVDAWIKVTRAELKGLIDYRYDIASSIGADGLLIVQKPSSTEIEMCLDSLKKIIQKKEAERIAREAKQKKAKEKTEAQLLARKVDKAKKDLAKAQKILKDAGAIK